MTKRAGFWLGIAILLVAASVAALAQGTSGSVTGAVADSSGAVITDAQVKLINTRTGVVQKTSTSQTGDYQFLLVPPGLYAVEVESKGFKTFRRDGIIVEVNRSLAVPVTLSVGAVSETIEVVGGTPLLEPNTSALGTVVDTRKVADLPLAGRNPLYLANLVPTVQGIGSFGAEIYSTWSMGQVVIAGGTPLNNGFVIDGIANEKMTDYSAMAFLPVDATQEFKVISNNMSAEYGRSGGGIISMISKSGTNQYHGNLFEYLRNTEFNSNEFFANKAGSPRPPVHYNTFGGTLGGPIKKEKLFFFVNVEEFIERRAGTETITAPTAAQRAGDFSSTFATSGSNCSQVVIYDPSTNRPDPSRPGQYLRSPFPGNKIPASQINPIAAAMLKYYPQPNLPGLPCSGAQNLFLASPISTDKSDVGIKVDYNIKATKRISGRFTRDYLDRGNANYFNNIADATGYHVLDPRRTAVLEYTDTLSPTLLLNARIGVNREQEQIISPSANFDVTSIGFSPFFASIIQKGEKGAGFPAVSITDQSSFGRPDSTGNPTATGTAGVSLTKIKGRHNIKMGYEQRLYRRSDWGTSNSSGSYTFGRGFTQGPDPLTASTFGGYGLATYLLGLPTSGSSGITTDTVDTMNYSAAYVQDDWKVNKKLTLNLGLRWEYEGPVKERRNVFPNFDPTVPSALAGPAGLSNLKGGYTFPGTNGIPNGVTDPNYKNFGPRLGFAYQLDAKSVVRGGYGISYIPTFGLGGTAAGAGFSTTTTMTTSIDGGITPYNTLSNPFPTGLTLTSGSSLGTLTAAGQAASAGQLRYVYRGYAQEWNVTVQHEPWANWLMEISWVGNKGTHLTMSRSLNQLPDQYLSLGTQLTNPVPNPFAGLISTGTLAAPTITLKQSLLPFPQFLSVTSNAYMGDSIYNAFTFKVEKRFSRGFSLLGSYVFSKLIDDMPATGRPGAVPGTSVQDWYNLRGERSRSYQDIPNRVVITGTWEVPFKSRNAILHTIAGGWQLNGMSIIQSGRPIALAATVS
ncbi:MAG TPA: TonB-dependent receptor, partial [Bryobacteraceae bacterium]